MNQLTLKILATTALTFGFLHGCDEKYSSRSKITQSESQSAGSSAKLLCPTDAEKCPDGTFVTRDPDTCEMAKCGDKKNECEKTVTTCSFPIPGTPEEFQPPPQECKAETLPCSEGDGGAPLSCGPGEQLKTTKVCKRDPIANQIECATESECVPSGGSNPGSVPPGGNDCPEDAEGCYSGQ